MNQNDCTSLPSHFIYLGVCYPGDHLTLTLSNPNNPQPTNFHVTGVPEPGTLALLAIGLVALGKARARRRIRT